jgi:hypothetical protein
MAFKMTTQELERARTIEGCLNAALAGEEGATHRLRKLILKLRWVGMEDAAMEAARRARALLPGRQARRIPEIRDAC